MNHNMELSTHQGAKKAITSITRCYYWPGIPTFVRKYVKACSYCTRRKASRKENAGMSIAQLAQRPGQVFQIDIWGPLPESESGNVYLLTFMDTFLRWPGAVPIPNRNAETIAKVIYEKIICEFGMVDTILSDRGKELIAKGVTSMCKQFGIRKVETGGYNARANGCVERFHRCWEQH